MGIGLLTTINISLLLLFAITVASNSFLRKKQKNYFIHLSIILASIVLSLYLKSIIMDNINDYTTLFLYIVNYFGYTILPLFPYFGALSIYPEMKTKSFKIIYSTYILFFIIANITGSPEFFTIDENNIFHRKEGYIIFLIIYLYSIALFLFAEYKLSTRYGKGSLFYLTSFNMVTIIGVVIQLRDRTVQTSWICLIITLILYYAYYFELFLQVDNLTYLYNYNRFLNKISKLRNNPDLVVIRIENFSVLQEIVPDEYLNQMIVKFSLKIKAFYENLGDCYRLDDSIFGVLIKRSSIDLKNVNKAFLEELNLETIPKEERPVIKMGIATITQEKTINQIIDEAKNDEIKPKISSLT